MQNWICVTCGTQFNASETSPEGCPVCLDQRQYVGHQGQQWTTLAQLHGQGFHTITREHEPGLLGIGTEPKFAIGQRALLVQSPQGNVLWDCITMLDEQAIAAVEAAGGLQAITISHPHYYSAMVEWAQHFNVPIYLHEADQRWVMRPDQHIQYWSGPTLKLTDSITVLNLGGHFPGSTALHWSAGADGAGVLLTGDTISVAADRNWVSFMYSYPNLLPLSAQLVRQINDQLAPYPFERLYSAWFETIIPHEAKNAVSRSAERYIRALAGDFPA